MFRVIFTYDEESRLWEPTVEGATDETEARQGFNAVVLSCQMLRSDKTMVQQCGDRFLIIPAV